LAFRYVVLQQSNITLSGLACKNSNLVDHHIDSYPGQPSGDPNARTDMACPGDLEEHYKEPFPSVKRCVGEK
jgi:hypothetical protein